MPTKLWMIWPKVMADPLWVVPGRAVSVSEISLAVLSVDRPSFKNGSTEKMGVATCHGKYCLRCYYTGLCFMGWKQRRNSA